jgi:chromosome segregation ATPase
MKMGNEKVETDSNHGASATDLSPSNSCRKRQAFIFKFLRRKETSSISVSEKISTTNSTISSSSVESDFIGRLDSSLSERHPGPPLSRSDEKKIQKLQAKIDRLQRKSTELKTKIKKIKKAAAKAEEEHQLLVQAERYFLALDCFDSERESDVDPGKCSAGS